MKHATLEDIEKHRPRGRIPMTPDYNHPYLAEEQIDVYAEALLTIAQTVFKIRCAGNRKPFLPPEPGERFGLRKNSIHDVALIVGECSRLLKLRPDDCITIENKVIKSLVEEKVD